MSDTIKFEWPGWKTVRLIGCGSFGSVYEIERDVFGNTEKAALKVISIPQNASDIEEMQNDCYDGETITNTFQTHLESIISEYTLMRKLNGSANIVHCDDVRYIQHDDKIGWDIYIKMELLAPLAKSLPERISESIALKVGADISNALILCEKHGIVHRDIKPQNIFISDNGDYKLGDFGIAKTVEKTMGGTKTGTYKYMAPEVYNNEPYGKYADIYSLGLVLYWLLNERRLPFLPLPPEKIGFDMESSTRDRRFSGEPLPAPAHGSEKLKAVVLKACAFNPADRYQTALEMRNALDALLYASTFSDVTQEEEDGTIGGFHGSDNSDESSNKNNVPSNDKKKIAIILSTVATLTILVAVLIPKRLSGGVANTNLANGNSNLHSEYSAPTETITHNVPTPIPSNEATQPYDATVSELQIEDDGSLASEYGDKSVIEIIQLVGDTENVAAPLNECFLEEYETKYVRSTRGNSVLVFVDSYASKKRHYGADEGVETLVLAKCDTHWFCLYPTSSGMKVGWINSAYLKDS